jgi:hypothetical protein
MGRALVTRPRRAILLLLGAGLLAGGCATLEQEKHVAPLFTQVSMAGGGQVVEALGGAILSQRDAAGRLVHRSLRPLVLEDRPSETVTLTRFLVPLGQGVETPVEETWRLLPVYYYTRKTPRDQPEEWTYFMLPGIYWAKREDRILRAWFPFGGVFERFLSYDRIEFVLWPLWTYTERHGRKSVNVLWPIFGVTWGRGGPSWHVWPIYGISRVEGVWDRRYFLWPFFHVQHNDLSRSPENRESRWMIWPLFGRSRRGSLRSTTVLWPFFGYAHDPETGFWAWDGPWPLVRIQRGGKDDYERTRFWPLYGHYRGDGLESTSVLWPLLGQRHEEYRELEKNREFFLPFWQHERVEPQPGVESVQPSDWRKLWPVFWLEHDGPWRRMAFPALNPLWRTTGIDRAYAWIWELYTETRGPDVRRQRSWLGLWRREQDAFEDRASLAGVWAHRVYRREGRRVRETSLLFGLLRWRSGGPDGLVWLPPAMPGPGWPLERSTTPLDRPPRPVPPMPETDP